MMDNLDVSKLIPNRLERLVAVEATPYDKVILYRRLVDGSVERSEAPFRRWVLVSTPALAACITVPHEDVLLEGDGRYRVRCTFATERGYTQALKDLKTATRANASTMNGPYRVFSDKTQQFLTIASARLFGNMRFEELRRMQIDIETRAEGEPHFPDAKRPGDAIMLVSIKDSAGFETCLTTHGSDEPSLLRELVRIIQERDPDVLEGHNLCNFDLPYIVTRCKMHGVPFAIGRDGSEPNSHPSRLTVAERIIPYTKFAVHGRHVVDTLFLVQLYDISHRDMESHGLKYAAKYFGVASPERTYVAGENITELFDQDPQTLMDYCLDDARETDALSRILSPSYFYQASLIPLSYQDVIVRGTGTRVDTMLCADYLLNNTALPYMGADTMYQGALTEGEKKGVFQNVWHVDVRSLYPSIIISRQLTPSTDSRGTFLRLLTGLRQFRLNAKDARKTAPPELKEYYDALQGTFKILINSFYGYVGFAQGTFNDYAMADLITATGRSILDGMRNFLEQSGAVVIEMDTDGIYFTPPAGEDSLEAMQERIQQTLPEGIEIEMDARYVAMLGYKSKNYALLHEDGKITMSGAALRSRGMEPFQRRYIREIVSLLLHGKQDEIPALHQKYADDITERRFPLADFVQREYLSKSPEAYAKKLREGKGKRAAAFELALKSGKDYKEGDLVEFYVTGDKKNVSVTDNSKLFADATPELRDENIPFYLAKLQQLTKKFTEEM
ncbi:MAG: hypothetical protein IJJ26_02655 [Victivallales bacterium]|nr:hypothetical protein [Victivallales bacterium]